MDYTGKESKEAALKKNVPINLLNLYHNGNTEKNLTDLQKRASVL